MGSRNRVIQVIALFVGLSFCAAARAQNVTATMIGFTPFDFGSVLSFDGSPITGGGVGQITWDGTGFGNPTPFQGVFNAFCLDLVDNITISSTDSFTIDDDLATAPKVSAGGPMGEDAAQEMRALYGEQYNSLSSDDELQAFQLVVWAITYNSFGDTTIDNSSNSFYAVSGFDSTVISDADAWYAEAFNSVVADTGIFNNNVIALIGDTAEDGSSVQDQVVIGLLPGGPPPPSFGVPEINAGAMVSLLILLAGFLALREAKPVA